MKKVRGFGTKREMIAGTLTQKNAYTNIKPWFHIEQTNNLVDVAIIGGGIASAALAKKLADRGVSVSLYCKDPAPAQGASGNRQGAVYPLLNGEHNSVSRVFAPAFLFARQFIDQAAQTVSFDHDWCGVTQLMWDDKSAKKLGNMFKADFAPELVTKLNIEQTNETVGLPVDLESVSYPMGGWLSPAQLTTGLLDDLAQQGKLSLHYDHKIDELKWLEETQQWQLTSGDKKLEHQAVVIATGHLFDSFTQTESVPLGKVKGQVSHIPTNEALSKLNTVLCYDGYMTPCNPNNQQHCIGASYDRTHLDQEFDPQAQVDNAAKLKHCLPQQSWPNSVDVSGNESRQGIRCVSRDHLPFIGNVGKFEKIAEQYQHLNTMNEANAPEVQQYPQLYAFIGLGSRGLSSAPLLAETLASQMCGDPLPLPNDVLETLHPSRMWVRKLRKGKALTEK